MDIVLICVTVGLCLISFLALLWDMAEHKVEYKICSEETDCFFSKITVMYSVLMILITLGIAFLHCIYYPENSIWTDLKRLMLLSILWPVGYTDIKTYRIPNIFILLGLIYRAILIMCELLAGVEGMKTILLSEVVAAGALLLAAVLCTLAMKGSVGFGDMKLLVVMGLFLGLDAIWSAIFMTLIVSFFIAVGLLVTRKKTRKDSIPFGPAMVIGTYLSVAFTGM